MTNHKQCFQPLFKKLLRKGEIIHLHPKKITEPRVYHWKYCTCTIEYNAEHTVVKVNDSFLRSC